MCINTHTYPYVCYLYCTRILVVRLFTLPTLLRVAVPTAGKVKRKKGADKVPATIFTDVTCEIAYIKYT